MIYNHAPFAQKMTITFETGYGMKLDHAYTMKFSVTKESESEKDDPIIETTPVKIDHEGQIVTYTLEVQPGDTQVDVSYNGPMAVYDEKTRKNGTFSVANIVVTADTTEENE